jgi:SpoIID/LytB domain protein
MELRRSTERVIPLYKKHARKRTRKIRRALTALATIAGLTPVLVAASGSTAAWALPASFTITGHGYGHGRGMGQYGALGYAQQGWSYQQILAHFYGGTTPSTTTVANIPVSLSELYGAKSVNVAAPTGKTLALNGANTKKTTLTVTRGQSVSVYGGGDVTVAGPWSTGSTRQFAGTISLPTGSSRVINTLPLQEYVEGVVPRESPASWPAAALEAQAVAARSYALAYTGNGASPICDNGSCQVYGGDPAQYAYSYSAQSNAAVTATGSEVLLCGSDTACGSRTQVALTEFSSSTGGYSAGGAFPAVPDAGDATPSNYLHTWTISVPASAVQGAYPSIGAVEAITVTSRNGLGDLGGRVLQMVLTGKSGKVTVTGNDFAGAVGLYSNWFAVTAVAAPTTTTTTTTTRVRATTTTTRAPATPVRRPPARVASGSPEGGYWVLGAGGTIYFFGNAPNRGSLAGVHMWSPVVSIASTTDGNGYWLLDSHGGVFTFGDARFYGSTGNARLTAPVVALTGTADSRGYWTVDSHGRVYTFGDAHNYGSTAALRLAQPVVSITRTRDGKGYWLVSRDGNVWGFGDARNYGSAGRLRLPAPIVGLVPTATGGGYYLIDGHGDVYRYGDAGPIGSLTGKGVNDVVSVTPTPDAGGFLIVTRSGKVYAFGDATYRMEPSHGLALWPGKALAIVARR